MKNSITDLPPFHLALPVHNLKQAAYFYGDLLGCSRGRSSDRWIDWNFFGHQLVTHLDETLDLSKTAHNIVDGKHVPAAHFGAVLQWSDWHTLKDRLKTRDTHFLIAPTIRFEGQAGEQAIFFITDPSGNALEFKSFKDMTQLFAT